MFRRSPSGSGRRLSGHEFQPQDAAKRIDRLQVQRRSAVSELADVARIDHSRTADLDERRSDSSFVRYRLPKRLGRIQTLVRFVAPKWKEPKPQVATEPIERGRSEARPVFQKVLKLDPLHAALAREFAFRRSRFQASTNLADQDGRYRLVRRSGDERWTGRRGQFRLLRFDGLGRRFGRRQLVRLDLALANQPVQHVARLAAVAEASRLSQLAQARQTIVLLLERPQRGVAAGFERGEGLRLHGKQRRRG